jgi:FhuF 2Fe-2S C-terminal domain
LRDELAALGPYFAVSRHEPLAPPELPWQPLRLLVGSSEPLRQRAAEVRAALATGSGRPVGEIELRTAASVAQLGLVARLVAPALGAALIDARLLELADAWWQPVLGGPVPLSLPEAALAGVPYDGPVVGALGRTLIDGPVRALVDVGAALSVSRLVLWGNVASAVNGAVAMVVKARPDLAPAAVAMAAQLLAQSPLEGTSTGFLEANFRRRSCCLIYRVAPRGSAAICGDCVLQEVG